MLADDLGADLGVAPHALPFRRRELALLAQHLGRHRELADVVQRRRVRHGLAQLGLCARRLRQQPCVLPQAQRPVPGGRGLVVFHRARQAVDDLQARALELRGALVHQPLELLLAVGERDVRAHPRAQEARVDRLGEVVHRAQLEALELVVRPGLAGKEHHRDPGRHRVLLEHAAHLEAARARHLDVEQDQVGPGVVAGELQRRAAVGRELDVVLLPEHLGREREHVRGIVDDQDHRRPRRRVRRRRGLRGRFAHGAKSTGSRKRNAPAACAAGARGAKACRLASGRSS